MCVINDLDTNFPAITVYLNRRYRKVAYIDDGSTTSLISQQCWESIGQPLLRKTEVSIENTHDKLEINGVVTLEVKLSETVIIKDVFYVVKDLLFPVILGRSFLKQFLVYIHDYRNRIIRLGKINIHTIQEREMKIQLRNAKTLLIAPGKQGILRLTSDYYGDTGLVKVKLNPDINLPDGVIGYKSVSRLEDGQTIFWIMNLTPNSVTVEKGVSIYYAIRAVLLQEDEEKHLRVIAYASRTLRDVEKRWQITEKEALAVVFCSTKVSPLYMGEEEKANVLADLLSRNTTLALKIKNEDKSMITLLTKFRNPLRMEEWELAKDERSELQKQFGTDLMNQNRQQLIMDWHEHPYLERHFGQHRIRAFRFKNSSHVLPMVVEESSYLRQLVTDALDTEECVNGGESIVVEIHETKMGKRKNNRGHLVDGVWVVGGVEKTTERSVFAFPVEKQNSETLLEVIKKHVKPGFLFTLIFGEVTIELKIF
ncbi:Aspartic peptidase domain-containing protein [Strongyloides ratti]|uniref:Aspartic peptidase domain-containing protein n=1 Tax=Strongyloides ratti TaxID=34506 RepID=A0A090L051_STRRB|nr:Aspartic peptidase domain-containing protein [Strongyloides ratti]CEF61512.1 Aspartic peptidase domain-containing protein [Strongyloides ratti]